MSGFVAAAVVGLLLVAGLVGGLFWLLSDNQHRLDSFKAKCVAEGGHLYEPGGIWFCLTTDGRFVEVYP